MVLSLALWPMWKAVWCTWEYGFTWLVRDSRHPLRLQEEWDDLPLLRNVLESEAFGGVEACEVHARQLVCPFVEISLRVVGTNECPTVL